MGDGKKINIWNDNWLMKENRGKIAIERSLDCSLRIVNELLLNGSWNKSTINKLFTGPDKESILKMPISSREGKDRLVWMYSSNRDYSVKSGYSVVKTKGSKDNGSTSAESTSTGGNQVKVWKFLWSLNVKHKLKHFMWKALKGHGRFGNLRQLHGKGFKSLATTFGTSGVML